MAKRISKKVFEFVFFLVSESVCAKNVERYNKTDLTLQSDSNFSVAKADVFCVKNRTESLILVGKNWLENLSPLNLASDPDSPKLPEKATKKFWFQYSNSSSSVSKGSNSSIRN